MLNKKNTTIERVIGKIDNDFNPDTSDWIPRVAAWCIDALNILKVLPTERKKVRLKVHERIAYSECTFDVYSVKIYDDKGCIVIESHNIDKCSACSSKGDGAQSAITNTEFTPDTINIDINNNPNRVPDYEFTETVNAKDYPNRYNYKAVHYDDVSERTYTFIDGNKIELDFDSSYIDIEYDTIITCKSEGYGCDLPVIPNNGLLLDAITYYCMYKMLCRGFKHPVFNLGASQYGTNPYYEWNRLKGEAKRSLIIDKQGDLLESNLWQSVFYTFTFGNGK